MNHYDDEIVKLSRDTWRVFLESHEKIVETMRRIEKVRIEKGDIRGGYEGYESLFKKDEKNPA